MTCAPIVHLADVAPPCLTWPAAPQTRADLPLRSPGIPRVTRRSPRCHVPGTARRHLFPVHTAARRSDPTAATGLRQPTGRSDLPMSTTISPITPAVLDQLAELDDRAGTAATVYELADQAVTDARADLEAAQARYDAAVSEWSRASAEATAATRAAAAARREAGVVLTASGYRPAVQS